jgi:hypothetical protein
VSSEFDNVPTHKDWFLMVQLIETAPQQFAASPDFAAEPTLKVDLCWKCGPRRAETCDGSEVREPRLKIFCECPRANTPPPIPADALLDGPFDLEIW